MSLDDNKKSVGVHAFLSRADEVLAALADILVRRRQIDLEKGKAGIVVPSKDELPKVLDLIMEAVGKGELDGLLSSLAQARSSASAKDTVTSGSRSAATKR